MACLKTVVNMMECSNLMQTYKQYRTLQIQFLSVTISKPLPFLDQKIPIMLPGDGTLIPGTLLPALSTVMLWCLSSSHLLYICFALHMSLLPISSPSAPLCPALALSLPPSLSITCPSLLLYYLPLPPSLCPSPQ